MNRRLNALRKLFALKKLDGYVTANKKNVEYFTGFSGGSMLLVPQGGESTLFVHAVNYEAAKEEAEGAHVELVKIGEDIAKRVADEINCLNLSHVGFDSLKASRYLKMKGLLEEAELEDAEEIVWSLRMVKDESELKLMKKAAELTSLGMHRALEVLTAGLREREVAAEVEYAMRKSGSDGIAFETIVGSGPSSAFPHGGCGDRKIRKGDFVVIDIGAKYRGYCADLTRTFVLGKPLARQLEIYEAVREAQSVAMNRVRAGVEAKEVDRVAREYISERGYGRYFVHSLGHGVGLDIHEPPTLGPASKDVLAYGNVVTVEPGIYVPKFGGVRIEDTVWVLDGQARNLAEAPVVLSP